MKQINSIKADSKYLYAESTTKDWDQAYEDAKSLLLVEIDNWVKSQGKKNEEIKGYVARIENNFMEVKTRRGNLFRVFVYIKKKNIMTYNEDVDVTVNSLNITQDESSPENKKSTTFESKTEPADDVYVVDSVNEEANSEIEICPDTLAEDTTTEASVTYTLNSKETAFVALSESSGIQGFLKDYASSYAKLSTMSKQQDCYVMLFSKENVEKHFKFVATEGKVLDLDTMQYDNLDEYKGLGYVGNNTYEGTHTDGTPAAYTHMLWTQLGRKFINGLMKSHGYLTIAEQAEQVLLSATCQI